MGNRVVNGYSHSSNGWPMVDEGSCTWVAVPGTDPPVSLEIQNGQPLQILRAFVADINAYVEPVRDRDTACWTLGNSVGDSNHLSATAVDIDWELHPFEVADAGWSPEKIAEIRRILDFYEGTVFWGNDWDDPKDAMHFQLASLANGGNFDTYGTLATQDFINRKIRSDGFSTYRRDGQAAPPPAPSEMTVPLTQNADGTWTSPSPAWAHLIMRESSGNATIIQQITDVNSGGNEAEGLFQITPRTWRAHGGDEFAPSARLAAPQEQAIVAARIFTSNPSGSDWGAGLSGREDAGQLAAGLVPAADTPVKGEDELSAEAEQRIAEIHGALFNGVPSQSIYRTPGEPNHWQLHELIKNDDGMVHVAYVEASAALGDDDALTRVAAVAAGRGATTDPVSVARAQAVLTQIEATNPAVLKAFIARQGATQ